MFLVQIRKETMCGIYAYKGTRPAIKETLAGLDRLLYRGYDSWGVASLFGQKLKIKKQVGALKVDDLKLTQFISQDTQVALGHTRWATHGAVTQKNAHPHLSSDGRFALVHNGIVENYHQLKQKLKQAGWRFQTETDTEVIVRLLEQALTQTESYQQALAKVYLQLKGRNTIALLTQAGEIWAVRFGSPLVVGLGQDEVVLSSDLVSLPSWLNQAVFLDNLDGVYLDQLAQPQFFKLQTQKTFKPKVETISINRQASDKAGYEHYMLKEIHQSPMVTRQVAGLFTRPKLSKLNQVSRLIHQAKQVFVVGSGSAGVAAGQIAYYLRTLAKIPAFSLIGADANSYLSFMDQDSVVIAPSQSGETADVIEVLEQAREKGAKIITYVNMPGSMMTRLADVSLLASAGPEICVMSTKVVLSQMAFGYVLASTLISKQNQAKKDLHQLAEALDELLADKTWLDQVKAQAHWLASMSDIYLLGKDEAYFVAKEGMIKMIEGSYLHAHALPAGDLKHYVITIVESGTPVVGLVTSKKMMHDMESALTEVKARGAETLALSVTAKVKADRLVQLPNIVLAELVGLVTLQLLGYFMAKELGHNIDKPRHIAKSVTVK